MAAGVDQLVPPTNIYRLPLPDKVWERIRTEFKLPTLDQVRQRLSTLHEDPEPVMQQIVRIFIERGYVLSRIPIPK